DAEDVRMLQPGRDLDLALEPVDADAFTQVGRQHLDDDPTSQRPLRRHEDARHAAAPELAFYGIAVPEVLLELGAEVRECSHAIASGSGVRICGSSLRTARSKRQWSRPGDCVMSPAACTRTETRRSGALEPERERRALVVAVGGQV